MPTETMTAVEMNTVDRTILDAEKRRGCYVSIPIRQARAMYVALGQATDADTRNEMQKLRDRVEELEGEVEALEKEAKGLERRIQKALDALED